MTEERWAQVLSRKCKCDVPQTEEITTMAHCVKCKACGLWRELRVGKSGDMEKMAEMFT